MPAARIKTSAIQNPSPDNTVTVQRQMKENIEVAQRLRGDPNDSFVRVSELTQGGLFKLVNDALVPGTVSSGDSVSITVANSITGAGTSASPLQLQGDSASPGNSMLYGTNGSGVKGWYSQPSSSASPLTTKGDVYGRSSIADARIPVGANGTVLTADSTQTLGVKWATPSGAVGVPGTIKDLVWWLQADQVLGTNGVIIPAIGNSHPAQRGTLLSGNTVGNGVSVSSSLLNSLPVLSWTNSTTGRYLLSPSVIFNSQVTVFIVAKPNSTTGAVILGGNQHSLEVDFSAAASGFNITKTFDAVIGSCTTTLSVGTWYQCNVTYNTSTGAYAFRVARAATNSGTSVQSITVATSGVGWNVQGGTNDLNADVAEIIVYNRVLTSGEITSVETYLNSKWGV